MSKNKITGYEKRKVAIDFFKHITTISVGLIALIASFLQKFIDLANSKVVVLFAVLSLFCTVICSTVLCFTLLQNIETLPFRSGAHWRVRTCALATILGFLSGVGSIVWLVVKNIA